MRVVRAAGEGAAPTDDGLRLWFLLAGAAVLEGERLTDGAAVVLPRGDAATLANPTPDLELLEVAFHADPESPASA